MVSVARPSAIGSTALRLQLSACLSTVADSGERGSASASFTFANTYSTCCFLPQWGPVTGTDSAEGEEMPKAREIRGWAIIAGAVLMAQGCWEDERVTLLGEGGCRIADGSQGTPTYVSGLSSDQCQAECFNENGNCTAVEYNTNNGQCEIHSEAIIKYEAVEGVFCYLRN